VGVILDTSVLIAAERRQLSLVSVLSDLGDVPVAIAAVTASELLHGCYRASDAAVRLRRGAFVEAVLRDLPIMPFDLHTARRHAELWAILAKAECRIGAHDMLIAATALCAGYDVASLNRREFQLVPGLRLIDLDPYRC
jgi:tRNA(fMet)-specific endonuclease VapC